MDLADSDAIQVIFNLYGGQMVDLKWPDRSVRNVIRAGSIGLNFPGSPVGVTIAGEADTIQIVITGKLVKSVTGKQAPASPPKLKSLDQLLIQAAGSQAVVALLHGREDVNARLDTIVRRIAGLVGRSSVSDTVPIRGGVAPGARQRVRALIDQSLRCDARPIPKVEELADAATLSVHHVIRAYYEAEGQTPHAHIATLRLDAALSLLLTVGKIRSSPSRRTSQSALTRPDDELL
jgi:AraC-like DNA-binding protein